MAERALRVHWWGATAFLALVACLLLPVKEANLRANLPRVGEVSDRSWVAPLTFEIPKSASDLDSEREKAKAKVPAVFEMDAEVTSTAASQLDSLLQQIGRYGELQAQVAMAAPGTDVSSHVREASELYQDLSRRLSTTAITQLSQSARARERLREVFLGMLDDGVCDVLIVPSQKQVELHKQLYNLPSVNALIYERTDASLVKDNRETLVDAASLRTREVALEDAFNRLQIEFPHSQGLQSAFYEILYAFTRPNVFYAEKETERRRTIESERIHTNRGVVVRGMEILPAGAIATRETIEKLEAMKAAMQDGSGRAFRFYPYLATWAILVLLSGSYMGWFGFARDHRFRTRRRIWALAVIPATQLLIFRGTEALLATLGSPEVSFLPSALQGTSAQPAMVAAVLATVLFDMRAGFIASGYAAAWLGISSGFDLSATFYSATIAAAGAAFLKDLRYRSQFLLATAAGAGAAIVAAILDGMMRGALGASILPDLVAGVAAALVAQALCSLILIHAFERIFAITTSLTLIELSDFNHPLLKRLSQQSPSSFNHSIMVANLAEKAAEQIGANALLTRVMALYHDIGKSLRPEFFTENQRRGGTNPHDQLDPWESTRIIVEHVEKGRELAREHRIPEDVASGIPEHHGDNVIHYFWRKAVSLYPKRVIDPEEFRYRGPRPRTKEAALLMLADSIEATSRSLETPDPASLTGIVQDVIRTRLEEEQFSQCDLTMNDLKGAETGFLQALEGMYHTRIQYPEGVFVKARNSTTKPKNAP